MTSRHTANGRIWLLDSPMGLAAMFAVGLIVRVALAPHLGFYGDLQLFQRWTTSLSQVGTHKFYSQAGFADYPPGYLYVLWVTGKISAAPGYLLIKLPAIEVRKRTGPTKIRMNRIDRPRCRQKGRRRLLAQIPFRVPVSV